METAYRQTGGVVQGSWRADRRQHLPLRLLLPDLASSPASRRLWRKARRFARMESVRFVLRLRPLLKRSRLNRAYATVLLSRVYIGGLSFDVTEAVLGDKLRTFGPVVYFNMPVTEQLAVKKNKGYAFANFELPEAALLAIETLNCTVLDGRPMRVGRPANLPARVASVLAELRRESPDADRLVYLASVPLSATHADLRAALSAYGEVAGVCLQPDPRRPGCHRGFGFAGFASPAGAAAAIEGRVDGVRRRQRPPPIGLVGRAVAPSGAVATGCCPAPVAASEPAAPNALRLAAWANVGLLGGGELSLSSSSSSSDDDASEAGGSPRVR